MAIAHLTLWVFEEEVTQLSEIKNKTKQNPADFRQV
jgi:hypothetical protein